MDISFVVTVNVPDDVVSYAEAISSKSDELIGEPLNVRSIIKDSYIKVIHEAFLTSQVKNNLSDIEDEIQLEYDIRRYPEWI